mgnify:CR=1 FL=1
MRHIRIQDEIVELVELRECVEDQNRLRVITRIRNVTSQHAESQHSMNPDDAFENGREAETKL